MSCYVKLWPSAVSCHLAPSVPNPPHSLQPRKTYSNPCGSHRYQELRKILSSSQHTPVDKSRGGKSSPTVSSNTAKPVSSAAKAIKAVNKLKK